MTILDDAAWGWLHPQYRTIPEGVTIAPIDGEGIIGAAQRTGLAHSLDEGVEFSYDGDTRLAAVWACGATTVDAVLLPSGTPVACRTCVLVPSTPSGPTVYRAYDANDQLLYVGSTINAPARMNGHASGTPWWGDVVRLAFETHRTEDAARNAEAQAIRDEPGIHNRASRLRMLQGRNALAGISVETSEATA